MTKKLSTDQIEWARRQYLNYASISEIARTLGVHRNTIGNYVHGLKGWKKERDFAKNELLTELAENKAAHISRIYGTSLDVLTRFVDDLKNRDKALTLVEARNLASILDSIDKIARLDQGSPTDIIADTKPASVIEVREILKQDPFIDYEEIDAKAIDHTTEDHSTGNLDDNDLDSDAAPTPEDA